MNWGRRAVAVATINVVAVIGGVVGVFLERWGLVAAALLLLGGAILVLQIDTRRLTTEQAVRQLKETREMRRDVMRQLEKLGENGHSAAKTLSSSMVELSTMRTAMQQQALMQERYLSKIAERLTSFADEHDQGTLHEEMADLHDALNAARRELAESGGNQIDLIRILQAQYLGRLDGARETLEEAVEVLRLMKTQ